MALNRSRRLLAALVGAVVIAVALLGTVSPSAAATDACAHETCDRGEMPVDDHDFPQHDPCLHDDACGGGGALQMGGGLVAVPVEGAAVPAAHASTTDSVRWLSWRPNAALIVGGIERPPRAA